MSIATRLLFWIQSSGTYGLFKFSFPAQQNLCNRKIVNVEFEFEYTTSKLRNIYTWFYSIFPLQSFLFQTQHEMQLLILIRKQIALQAIWKTIGCQCQAEIQFERVSSFVSLMQLFFLFQDFNNNSSIPSVFNYRLPLLIITLCTITNWNPLKKEKWIWNWK